MALSDIRPRRCSRRRMNMFYLIDTSGSMRYNNCIDTVNKAMPEIVDILTGISRQNHDQGEIYMSCITFGTEAKMLYDSPVAAEDFRWAPVRADGLTNLEGALSLLESQLHRSTGLNGSDGHYRPAVILITDGDPDEGWEAAYEKLRQNRWFAQAYKIGIAIGADPEKVKMRKALTRFADPLDAGGPKTIINVSDLDKLHNVLRLVSSTVSRLGSKCAGAIGHSSPKDGDNSVGDEMRNTIKDILNPIDGVDVPAIGTDDDWWL